MTFHDQLLRSWYVDEVEDSFSVSRLNYTSNPYNTMTNGYLHVRTVVL